MKLIKYLILFSSESFVPHLNQLILECKIHSDHNHSFSPSIVWQKNGHQLHPSGDRKYSIISHENGRQQLLISNPSPVDSGHYTCRAETAFGEILDTVSCIVNVPVEEKPQSVAAERQSRRERGDTEYKQPIALESFLKNLTIEENGRAKFICSIIGPVSSVDWYKDNKLLATQASRRYRTSNENGLVSLEILDADVDDSGFYTCTVHGRRNDVTSSSRLTVYPSIKTRRRSVEIPPIRVKRLPIPTTNTFTKYGNSTLVKRFSRSHNIHFDSTIFRLGDSPSTYRARVPSYEHLSHSSYRAHTPISCASRYSATPSLSYRSKSYHGDLNRLTPFTLHDTIGSTRSYSRLSNSRDLSSSTYDLSPSHASYINAYSRHHSHHHQRQTSLPRPQAQLNSRNRFRTRISQPVRSRSANPPDRYRSSVVRDYTPRSFVAKSYNDISRKPLHSSSHSHSHSSRSVDRTAIENLSIKAMYDLLDVESYVRYLKSKRECSSLARDRYSENIDVKRFKSYGETVTPKRSQPLIFTRSIKGKRRFAFEALRTKRIYFFSDTEVGDFNDKRLHFMFHFHFYVNFM